MARKSSFNLSLSGADAILIVNAMNQHVRVLDQLVDRPELDDEQKETMECNAMRGRRIVKNFVDSCGFVDEREMN